MGDAVCCFPKDGPSDPGAHRAGVGPPGFSVLFLGLKVKGTGREEMPGISKGAMLFRDEHWAESQGCGFWSCSALNLLFDLGLIPSPP